MLPVPARTRMRRASASGAGDETPLVRYSADSTATRARYSSRVMQNPCSGPAQCSARVCGCTPRDRSVARFGRFTTLHQSAGSSPQPPHVSEDALFPCAASQSDVYYAYETRNVELHRIEWRRSAFDSARVECFFKTDRQDRNPPK